MHGIHYFKNSIFKHFRKSNQTLSLEIILTHHWRISESFDGLKDASTDGSHCESTTTIIHYSPGAKNINIDKSQQIIPQILQLQCIMSITLLTNAHPKNIKTKTNRQIQYMFQGYFSLWTLCYNLETR